MSIVPRFAGWGVAQSNTDTATLNARFPGCFTSQHSVGRCWCVTGQHSAGRCWCGSRSAPACTASRHLGRSGGRQSCVGVRHL